MTHKIFYAFLALCLVAAPQALDAQLLNFDLAGSAGSGLLPGNENPSANSTASGDAISIVFDSATGELNLDVAWGSGNGFTDLTGDAIAMHIHGPAGFTANGPVLYNLGSLAGFDASASSGGLTGSVSLAAGVVQTLLGGNLYLNNHTPDNPGGELRANLVAVAVPEPSSVALIGLSGALLAFRRRR